jgi:hypothetical protein
METGKSVTNKRKQILEEAWVLFWVLDEVAEKKNNFQLKKILDIKGKLHPNAKLSLLHNLQW